MSPIRAEQRALYAPDWRDLSLAIRKNRAHDRCECDGRCGREIPEHVPMSDLSTDLVEAGFAFRRCMASQGQPSAISGKPVVLTVAHLDHDPTNNARSNLAAFCQACHLAYDAEHHAETRAARRATVVP